MYLEILDYADVHSVGKHYVRKYIGNEAADFMDDESIKKMLLSSNLIDTEVIRFLRYLVCIGVFYFSASQLGLFNLKNGISLSPDLLTCIKYAFAFVLIEKVDSVDVLFEGNVWDGVNIFLGIGH